ncbi:hypothetical protein WJT74_09290 [Sphingomicrobium sp. XHP0239]|uniref:hypothetical protein n=1 Tax=Sphingomicrobium maritimum TaxID=3133972 RepID=UPI0031CC4C94
MAGQPAGPDRGMIGDWMFRRRDGSRRWPMERASVARGGAPAEAPCPEPTPRVVVNAGPWTARDWRAMIALWASIVGAGVITLLLIWTVRMVRRIGIEVPGLMAIALDGIVGFTYGLLVILGAILLSLGLAINRRSFSAKAFGASIEASGGAQHPDDPA